MIWWKVYVQRRFLKYLYFRKHRVYPHRGVSQVDLISEFHFVSPKTRRMLHDVKILCTILNNTLDLDRHYFNISFADYRVDVIHKQLFCIPHAKTNTLINSPLIRMCRLGNKSLPVLDFTDTGFMTCSSGVTKLLLELLQ